MSEERLCINCRHVKPLDDIVGRCLAVKTGMQFVRLRDPNHVCEGFKAVKDKEA